jgi:SRSO17 transposase
MQPEVPSGVVLADAGYERHTISQDLTELGLPDVVGIESSATVWELGRQPLPAPARKSSPNNGAR